MTRQACEQKRNVEAGFCQFHAKAQVFAAGLCEECYLKRQALYTPKKRHYGPHKISKEEWLKVNWNFDDRSLAKLKNVSLEVVRYQRRVHGHATTEIGILRANFESLVELWSASEQRLKDSGEWHDADMVAQAARDVLCVLTGENPLIRDQLNR